MELRNYIDTKSNPSHIDQPSIKSSPTVLKQDYSPTPSHTKTSTDSSQIEHSLTLPCESWKGSSSNQGTTFKVPEVLPTLEKPGEECGECPNGVEGEGLHKHHEASATAIKYSDAPTTPIKHLSSVGTASKRKYLWCNIIRN
jgi:hypothetical protein